MYSVFILVTIELNLALQQILLQKWPGDAIGADMSKLNTACEETIKFAQGDVRIRNKM